MDATGMTKRLAVAAVIALLGTPLAAAPGDSLAGKWDAIVVANGAEVPFPFEIVQEGQQLKASLFNGDLKITSTAATVDGSKVVFTFGQYGSKVVANVANGKLEGEYQRARGNPFPFRASRQAPAGPAAANVPKIDGTWIVQAKSNKGETAWRFIARQSGARVDATILRVDGDTGTLTGSYKDGRFVLGHFSGGRPLLLEVTPKADGTLVLKQNGQTELMAARENTAAAAAWGAPTDPSMHTRMKDPSEPFRFSAPDMTGKVVSNTDAKFAGKVVLVNISGSWCPNCHDEAPFLSSLYKKYNTKGFEIVTLSFEEDEQQAQLARLREFNKIYGITWTVLVPGNPDQLNEKVPQADNLNAFPTSFILGRDGRVKAVHAGFPSPGSGEYYKKAEREVTELVERLLAEKTTSR